MVAYGACLVPGCPRARTGTRALPMACMISTCTDVSGLHARCYGRCIGLERRRWSTWADVPSRQGSTKLSSSYALPAGGVVVRLVGAVCGPCNTRTLRSTRVLKSFSLELYAQPGALLHGILPRPARNMVGERAQGAMLHFEDTDEQFIGRYAAIATNRPLFLHMTKQRPKLAVAGSSVLVDEEYLDLHAAGLAATDLPAIKQLFGELQGTEPRPGQRVAGIRRGYVLGHRRRPSLAEATQLPSFAASRRAPRWRSARGAQLLSVSSPEYARHQTTTIQAGSRDRPRHCAGPARGGIVPSSHPDGPAPRAAPARPPAVHAAHLCGRRQANSASWAGQAHCGRGEHAGAEQHQVRRGSGRDCRWQRQPQRTPLP
mmetsp:Transcript_36392/g.90307  ORF Transcript_36392/g.90307 Transcript_36392/m.90307 type:complete len:373 (-) Transcript_36392:47-1165(-)